MPDPFIIMCAPNGARRKKENHPEIPLSPKELGQCAREILQAGASIIHLHVRDDNHNHSLDPSRYREAIAAIKESVGNQLVIQITTEAVGIYQRQEQINVVKELRPEAVSIALREICPLDEDIESCRMFFLWMKDNKVSPQIILYDAKDCTRFESMRSDGVFATPTPFTLFVVGKKDGVEGARTSTIDDFIKGTNNTEFPWAACSFGTAEYELAEGVLPYGGHIRVGFENNIWDQNGNLAHSNAALITHSAEKAQSAGRTIATAEDVRKILRIERKNS